MRLLPWISFLLAISVAAGSPDGMKLVPSGNFEPFFKDQTTVSLNAFYLDTAPVSNADFLAFVRANPDWKKGNAKRIFADAAYLAHWSSPDTVGVSILEKPVVNVSFFAAKAYCTWKQKRLPLLAEWEFALLKNKTMTGWIDLPGSNWEWVSDFNSVMLPAESRGVDKAAYCGNSGVDSKDPRAYDTFMRYAFRSSLKANYNTGNLGFRCAKSL